MSLPSPVFQTILVPIDGSALSEEAGIAAIDLAQLTQASLVFLFVSEANTHLQTPSQTDMREMLEPNRAQGQTSLGTLQANAERRGVKNSSLILADKHPARGIIRARTIAKADLIFMASQGYRGFKKLLLGSTATEVLTRVKQTPVLIYKAPSPEPEEEWECDL